MNPKRPEVSLHPGQSSSLKSNQSRLPRRRLPPSSQPPVYVTSVDFLQYRVSYSTHIHPMGADGASSITESSPVTPPPRPRNSAPPSRMPADGQTNIRPTNPRNSSTRPIKPSAAKSARLSINTNVNQKPPATAQYRKSRLPWLDGNRSRQGSHPPVPGAFVDNSPTSQSPPASALTPKAGQTPTSALEETQNPDKKAVALDLVNLDARNQSDTGYDSTKPSDSGKPLKRAPISASPVASTPSNQLTQHNDADKALETASIATNPSPGSHPAPIIDIARELYSTGSSDISDSEASLQGQRKRALESLKTDQRELLSPLQTVRAKQSRVAFDEEASPKAVVGPKKPSVSPSLSLLSPSGFANRKPSLTVQPIRSNKVSMSVDDLAPNQRDRQRSISVQPIKSHLRSSKSGESTPRNDGRKGTLLPSQLAEMSTGNLQDSIGGLENLMQEAMQLARQAAENNRSDEVPAILDEATSALHRSSVVLKKQEKALKGDDSPVALSPASSAASCSSCASESSQDIEEPKLTGSMGGPRSVWDDNWQHHRNTNPQSASVDWAYSHKLDQSQEAGNKGGPTQDLERGSMPTATTNNYQTQAHPKNERASLPKIPAKLATIMNGRKVRKSTPPPSLPTKEEVRDHIKLNHAPPFFPRSSSLRPQPGDLEGTTSPKEAALDTNPNEIPSPTKERIGSVAPRIPNVNWGSDKYDERDYAKTDDILRGKNHVTLKDGENFSVHHGHRRQPIARNWSTSKKRFTAVLACLNTALVGVLIGIYAGEVPAIQYALADTHHLVILGNVFLYVGMAITTFFFWPLPLLHGRKPYTVLALGIALPLQIPPALIVQGRRTTVADYSGYMAGLLLSRGVLGLALGFATINLKSTLLDLYGASLQSEFPHGEVVITDDVRRHGGGMGYWLGIWSFSFIGSLALGFMVGADIISGLPITWGFYVAVILLALMLILNVIAPETRRAPHRRTLQEVELPNESISRRVARGEVKMHVTGDGPKWWWEEVTAGVYLNFRMLAQSGFLIMALYLAWIYAEIVLVIVLLGNLLSAEYAFHPEYVGLGVLAIGIGALLAVPTSKANFFSRSRTHGPRTDSMTFREHFNWSSHLARRATFMIALPIAGVAYTLASKGKTVSFMLPIVFAALIGYISNLAIAECNGIIMETFDTSDLQPGTNSRHRLQSLAQTTKRRRTTYSSYPRVSAGLFVSQSLGFLLAAAATGVGGAVTRTVGAQKATAITAGILMGLTLLLTFSLIRFRAVQVIPNELFGSYFGSAEADRTKSVASVASDRSWRAVVIGNPSGRTRRMNWLELGSLSRWTEIRRLNRLLTRSTTQALNPGWQ